MTRNSLEAEFARARNSQITAQQRRWNELRKAAQSVAASLSDDLGGASQQDLTTLEDAIAATGGGWLM